MSPELARLRGTTCEDDVQGQSQAGTDIYDPAGNAIQVGVKRGSLREGVRDNRNSRSDSGRYRDPENSVVEHVARSLGSRGTTVACASVLSPERLRTAQR